MNEKVNIQSLSEQLSQRHGLSKDSADDFVREFFNLIADGLEKDHLVKVKGLGTFKVIDVEDRESVDVNTKERIVIKGHSKVTFTPEATLKEAINKPFEAFETTFLDENTPLEAMTRIPEEDDTLKAIQELYGKTGKEESASGHDEILSDLSEDVSEINAMPSETDEVEAAEEAPATVAVPEEETAEEPAAAEEQPKEAAPIEEEQIPETESPANDAPSADDIIPEAGITPVEAEGQEDGDFPAAGDSTPETLPVAAVEPLRKEMEAKPRDKEKESSGNGLKVFSWIILLLILLCGAFIASLYWDDIKGWFSGSRKTAVENTIALPQEPAQVSTDTIAVTTPASDGETAPATQAVTATQQASSQVKPEDIKVSEVKVPSAQPKATGATQASSTSKPATTAAAQPKTQTAASTTAKSASTGTSTASAPQKLKEGVSYKIDGTLTTHVIQKGETLRTIALKYYGSKSFSSYIVQHNAKTIKNPDNVPAGSKINIPKLVEK